MAAEIISLNLNPNIQWWIKIGPSGGQGLIEFFASQADVTAGTNRVAYGIFAFGEEVEITLTQDAETPVISLFCDQDAWHCIATLLGGDTQDIFSCGPYTDGDEITDPLFASAPARYDRGKLEIDKGTHIKITREIVLGTHIQGLEVGDPARLTDNMRGLNQSVKITGITIRGDRNSLTDMIRTVEYEDLVR